MAAKIISINKGIAVLQVEINLSGTMLNVEEVIQDATNEVGQLATEQKLKDFDTDGTPIIIAGTKYTAKVPEPKLYQTPYGAVSIDRYVYQSSKGGQTYCPLEEAARIIVTSTPRFAKVVSNKYARMSAGEAIEDMRDNHGRKVARSFIQNITDAVGSIAMAKEEHWEYELPELKSGVKTISISLDGANVHMMQEGYREAMAGSISLYDKTGERLHSMYIAAEPEYGKKSFLNRMEQEIQKIKKLYPSGSYVGVADGAKDNWTFLEKHTEFQILDFYHASQYLGDAAAGIFYKKSQVEERKDWLEKQCHDLKHKHNAAGRLLTLMRKHAEAKLPKASQEKLNSAITYFKNNKHRMQYANHVEKNLPIGSGVIEAACKTIIKYRLCGSGMRWKNKGAKLVLSLRPLVKTKGRWNQFWEKISKFGVPHLANK